MSEILIIGSEGFIGSHCVKYFLAKGYAVFGADLFEQPSQPYKYTKTSRLSPDFNSLLATTHFDIIINAAGSANVPYSMQHPVADFEANSLDTILVLDAIKAYQPATKYIHFSSAAVYGNPTILPVKESTELQPLSPYGWHKLIAEQICKEYAQLFGLKTVILRPFSIYGAGLKKQMFWDLYQKCASQHFAGNIEIFGTGNESRDYLYIDDLVEAVYTIANSNTIEYGTVFNIASGIETTIKEVVQLFFNHLAPDITFNFNNQVRLGDPLNWRADISSITSLGFKPSISLEQGIYKLSSWLKVLHEKN